MTTDHQQNGTWRSGQGQYAQPGVVMQPLVSQLNGEIIHEQKWGQLYAHQQTSSTHQIYNSAHQDEHLPNEEHHMPTITYQDAPVI
ncbi:unnamed protein product [Oikopleura dioica]|uniref:Uncharacterized protein n=1 Tax=Oikopleura dioica TaxID=34765 RepID=E4XY72_OIKDI|nr:unnamed protein product [Oikopleura dioica]CBY38937.1 unnamed protein product [Oikopleura dioica]